jgi:acyl-CoA thioester hydrolase
MQEYSFTHIITQEQIDFNGHVNNLEYIKLGLRAAGEHWRTNADKNMQEQCLWVVKRHEIDYQGEALLNDEVKVATYIIEISKAIARRKIIMTIHDKVICTMITEWYLLDRERKRPMRITEEISQVFGF